VSDTDPGGLGPSSGRTPDDYRTLLERVPAIVYIADEHADGRWRYVSPWIKLILGFTVEEWLADNLLWMKQLHPDDREETIELEREMEISFADEPKVVVTEYRMLHRDGSVVWIRDDSVLLPDQNGKPRWYGVLSDITAAKQVELEIERQAAATAALAALVGRALKGISVQQLLDDACTVAAEVLGVKSTVVVELSSDSGLLEMGAIYGWDRSEVMLAQTDQRADSQAGHALLTGEPTQVVDWDSETRFVRSQMMIEHGIRSSLYLRIDGRDNTPFGVFGVLSTEPRTYSENDINFVRAMTATLSDAIERDRAEQEIEHRALHDILTDLPNRVLFQDRVEQAFERVRRHRKLAAVLFIDVDDFKYINDTQLHSGGDQLLISVAARLREAVRPTDTVARWGGDEFGLLLDEITSERDAIATAQRLAASFAREPFVIGAASLFVTLSIGIALTDGHEQPDELIGNADKAMYLAKDRGGARYEMFDEDMRVRDTARLRQKQDLDLALEKRQLSLSYQPIVALSDNTISGAEVLLRWNHPERGPIEAAEFIPVAEESGQIHRIGQWMLEEACRDAAKWAQARPDAPPMRLYVNVSAAQFANTRLSDVIAEAMEASKLPADQLSVEISERVLLGDSKTARSTLRRLQRARIEIVVDDFGSGQSSASQLSSMPVSAVKLDRRSVANLANRGAAGRAARAAVAMAKALDLRVIAGGTERDKQVQQLIALGCGFAQGYLFSPPVSAAELTAMLVDGARLPGTGD